MATFCQYRPWSGLEIPPFIERRWSLVLLTTLLILGTRTGICPVGVTPAVAATLWLTGPESAVVTLNGQTMGTFPLAEPLALPPGHYVVRCQLTGYSPYEKEVFLETDEDWLRLRVRLVPLDRKTAILSSLAFAGLGQHYLGKSTKGWLLTAAEASGLLAALYGELSFQNHRDDYLLRIDQYQRAVSAEDISFFKRQADESFSKMEDAETVRDAGLIVAASAVILSVLDAWFRFPSLAAGSGTHPAMGRYQVAPDLFGADLLSRPEGLNAFHVHWCTRF
jgi:hypothetical protein